MSYHDRKHYKAAQKALYKVLRNAGANFLARQLSQSQLLVLTYHDVLSSPFHPDNPLFGMAVSRDVFQRQMEYISTRYNFVSMPQVLHWLRGDGELPVSPVLITFDDGHRNTLMNAVPILSRMGIKAAFFVLSEMIGSCSPTWYEEIYLRIMASKEGSIELIDGSVHFLRDDATRSQACDAFFDLCRTLDSARQREQLGCLMERLQPSPELANHRERFEFMSEPDIHQLVRQGHTVGSHSLSHQILSTLSDEEAAREIRESCEKLSEMVDSPIECFAYPFGDRCFDFSRREMGLVKRVGCIAAFAANSGFASCRSNAFDLPRVGIGAKCEQLQFECRTSGSLSRTKTILGLT